MKRGEVWWAELPGSSGRRPVVLLSRDEAYSIRELVTVAPVSTRIRGIPVEVALGKEDGLPRPCVANLDVITTVPKRYLSQRVSSLSQPKMDAVQDALRYALGLPEEGPATIR